MVSLYVSEDNYGSRPVGLQFGHAPGSPRGLIKIQIPEFHPQSLTQRVLASPGICTSNRFPGDVMLLVLVLNFGNHFC